jgi:hypothetical protein
MLALRVCISDTDPIDFALLVKWLLPFIQLFFAPSRLCGGSRLKVFDSSCYPLDFKDRVSLRF